MTEIKVDKNNENCFISVKGHNKDSKICAMISALGGAFFCAFSEEGAFSFHPAHS